MNDVYIQEERDRLRYKIERTRRILAETEPREGRLIKVDFGRKNVIELKKKKAK